MIMATIKSYTDVEQSKKLAKILALETSDMIYTTVNWYHTPFVRIEEANEFDEDDIPCWSLAALLGVLPKYALLNFGDTIHLQVNLEVFSTEGDEPLLDLVVGMIIHLNGLKML